MSIKNRIAAGILVAGIAISGPLATTNIATAAPSPAPTTTNVRVAAAATTPVLFVNASSPYSNIRAMQFLLNANGVGTLTSGKYDATTKAAVVKFQEKNHLAKDGSAGPATMGKMIHNVAYGNPNVNSVKAVQVLLVKLGYKNAIDGGFGTVTRSNVRWHQANKMKVAATGIVDAATWAWLFNPPVVSPAGQLVPLSQLASNGGGQIGGHNCGPTSATITVLRLGKVPVRYTTADRGGAAIRYMRTGTMGAAATGATSLDQVAKGIRAYGFTATTANGYATLLAAVRAGKVVVLNGNANATSWPVHPGGSGYRGHYIVVGGYSNGKYLVADPISVNRTVYSATEAQLIRFTSGRNRGVIAGK